MSNWHDIFISGNLRSQWGGKSPQETSCLLSVSVQKIGKMNWSGSEQWCEARSWFPAQELNLGNLDENQES